MFVLTKIAIRFSQFIHRYALSQIFHFLIIFVVIFFTIINKLIFKSPLYSDCNKIHCNPIHAYFIEMFLLGGIISSFVGIEGEDI